MGAKESKQTCINYDEAIKRVSEAELRRLKDAFKKSAGVGRLYLSRNAFQQDVLCEGVPTTIAELLYTACGGTGKGISFKDLLSGLVLITRGSENEKAKFLWNLCCNDYGFHTQKSDLLKSFSLHPYESGSLFTQSDRISFEQFEKWILRNAHSSELSKWLLTDNCLSLTSELETPTFYQSLAGVTHLEEKDIGDLEKEFWRLKNTSPNGQLDFQFVGPLLSPPIPKNALQGLFNAFDENRDGHIDFKELCCGVSAACRGPSVERTRFCFKIFDVDRDGVLNSEEISQMINVLLFVAKESRSTNQFKNLNKSDALEDIAKFSVDKLSVLKSTMTNMVGEADDCILTVEDFMMWSVDNNWQLLEPFLNLIFAVCHIVFGLWPQCRHMEYDIVKGWLEREERRNYRVGQFWYLISHDWWLNWLQYTNNKSILCNYCKHNGNNNNGTRSLNSNSTSVDEALVCDESFNTNSLESVGDAGILPSDDCSIGSASSGVSTGRHIGSRPGPIDNNNLVAPNLYKNVRTLTGEGGHLKKDTPLVQGHHFELIPKSLWKALNRWYGDNLPLPRQVIQSPNSTDVELELYPLNLRILLHQNMAQTNLANNWSGTNTGTYGIMTSGAGFVSMSATNILQPPKRYLAYTAAFSRLATVQQVGAFLCAQLRLRPDDIRLWHIPHGSLDSNAILLDEDDITLEELLIRDNDQILIEIRNKDQTWPEELSSLALNQTGSTNGNDRRLTRTSIMSVQVPGATGLHNLGNTCFMNAALQVLFNTQPLALYFRQNMHLFELNFSNKLGTRGHLATRYGELLKEVWNATTRSVAPLKLRFCVTKHAPQFAGGGQHDSQELLEWFLDALHEDLNRVMDKPYSELKDSNGRPDKIVAAEAWAQHHARNQSIIIDLFYGQLKSKVSCLCCGRESVRFDPFSLLSLPLPVENYMYFEVLVILLDGSVPIKYGVRLNSESRYYDLKRELQNLCGLHPNLMCCCEVWNSQIRCILSDDEKVRSPSAKELYVYQLPEKSYRSSSQSSSILATNIEQGLKDIQRSSDNWTNSGSACSSGSDADVANNDDMGATIIKDISTDAYDGNHVYKELDVNDEDDDDVQVTTKVRRCFGNTMCMPQNLLCFKHSHNLNRSPDNIFNHGTLQKRISSLKLLPSESVTGINTSTQHSVDNSIESSTAESTFSSYNAITNDDNRNHCPCRQNISENDRNVSQKKYLHNVQQQINVHSNRNGLMLNHKHSHQLQQQELKCGNYLIAVHRKITRQDSYFLSHHKTRPSIFGIPLIIPNVDGATHKDLYCAVWLQVSRLLSPLPAVTDQANHAADCDDSLGYDFPFSLRAVKSDGLTCARCQWSNFCRGCEIPCNNDYIMHDLFNNNNDSKSINMKNETLHGNFTIAIDWDPTALHLRYQSTLEKLWIDHETVVMCRREQIEPVDLNHCLKAFTSEEKLEQWYHCSHCKGKKPATKKLQIWKLPPIMIVHLKRFNCVNGKWVKSQKVVHFPFDNFDPTPYLAAVPQKTILRHRELSTMKQQTANTNTLIEESENTSEHDNISDQKPLEQLNTHRYDNDLVRDSHKTNANTIPLQKDGSLINDNNNLNETLNNIINLKNHYAETLYNCSTNIVEQCLQDTNDTDDKKRMKQFKENIHTVIVSSENYVNDDVITQPERLVSSSLTTTPIIDGHCEDYHQHKLKGGEDKFDPKYKLYAVVSHSGMLNGGHYVSYAANPNGNWYCYNDSSCREINSPPNIDPCSAYLLFYERKGLDYEPYLPNIEGKSLPNGDLSVLEMDESDNDLKKLCTIS